MVFNKTKKRGGRINTENLSRRLKNTLNRMNGLNKITAAVNNIRKKVNRITNKNKRSIGTNAMNENTASVLTQNNDRRSVTANAISKENETANNTFRSQLFNNGSVNERPVLENKFLDNTGTGLTQHEANLYRKGNNLTAPKISKENEKANNNFRSQLFSNGSVNEKPVLENKFLDNTGTGLTQHEANLYRKGNNLTAPKISKENEKANNNFRSQLFSNGSVNNASLPPYNRNEEPEPVENQYNGLTEQEKGLYRNKRLIGSNSNNLNEGNNTSLPPYNRNEEPEPVENQYNGLTEQEKGLYRNKRLIARNSASNAGSAGNNAALNNGSASENMRYNDGSPIEIGDTVQAMNAKDKRCSTNGQVVGIKPDTNEVVVVCNGKGAKYYANEIVHSNTNSVRSNERAAENMNIEEKAEYNKLSPLQQQNYMRIKPNVGLNNSMKSWRNAMEVASNGKYKIKKSKSKSKSRKTRKNRR
jgi:CRISPR/Cas system-associated protein endoribonuclease Cas2